MINTKVSNICPTFFENFRDFYDFIRLYGPQSGRFIYNTHPEWILEAVNHAKENLSVMDSKRVLSAIRKVSERGYLYPLLDKEVASATTWEDRTEYLLKKNINSEYIVGSIFDHEPYQNWQEVYFDIQEKQIDKILYKGSLHELFSIIEPYITISKELWFIDPYFDVFSQKSSEFFKRLLLLCRNSKPKTINLVVKQIDLYKNIELFNDASSYLGHFFTENSLGNVNFNFFILSKAFLKKHSQHMEFHDRWLFTNKKGLINFGKGFIMKEQAKKPSFNLTIHGEASYEEIKRNIIDRVNTELALQKNQSFELIWTYSKSVRSS